MNIINNNGMTVEESLKSLREMIKTIHSPKCDTTKYIKKSLDK